MEFAKNSNLIVNICNVYIRSTDAVVNLPELQAVYHTPSKISYTSNGTATENGNLHTKTLRLTYPGLSTLDFDKFNTLIKGVYQVYVALNTGEVYEVASTQFPMQCRTEYTIQSGHQLLFTSTAPFSIAYIDTVAPIPGQVATPLDQMFNYDFDFNLA